MLKKLLLYGLGFFLLSLSGLEAQSIEGKLLHGIKPRAIGPGGMSGRVTAIDVLPDNPQVMYVGTASGGLWKSESGGIDWQPIFDKEKVASIGALKISPQNPDVIWVGTGEGNPRNSHTGGYGVYRSLDGGKTWQHMGLEKTRNIHRIIIHPHNPNVVYIGAIGTAWGEHAERGVYKTNDGGKTWQKILYRNPRTGAADLVIDPLNPEKLIAAMWEHKREPWFFKSGGDGSGLFITYDGGENWQELNDKNGLPKGELGRIGVAISPANPKIIYAIVEAKKNGLYRSEDGGKNWRKVTDKGNFGNRPFYYSEIHADPQNENRLFSLWSYVSKSEDGGRTWEVIADYGNRVHPDHHAFWIHPDNPQFIINGNDGGLNISYDGGRNWRFIENLPVGQFYHVSVDMAQPYNIYGGMQDNGSWQGPAYVWRANGIRNAYWEEIFFGDGFDVLPDPSDTEYAYAMSQEGNIAHIHLPSGRNQLIKPVHPEGTRLRFNWDAALAADPFTKTGIYFGSQFVHYSPNRGQTWEILSPDLTTNDPEKQKQGESGGLTYDVTGAENFTTITVISPSPRKEGVIWVGTDDGNIQLTQDGGKTWQKLNDRIKGLPKNGWVHQIKASEHQDGEAFVVIDNHRQDDWTPYVYHTKDFGKTWQRLAENVWGYALSLVQDPEEPKLLFLGTEFGLYFSIDYGKNWNKWTEDYPTVSTMDMAIHPREHDLVIGTFGRSIYVIDDIRPLRALAKEGYDKVMNQNIKLFEPPPAFLTYYRQASGTRFSAQGMFQGDNRRSGAMLSFALKEVKFKGKKKDKNNEETEKEEEEENKADKTDQKPMPKDTLEVSVEIFDQNNESIRKFKVKPKPGINRFYWSLDRRGLPRIGSPKPKPDDNEPRGASVLPGKYKVRLSYEDWKDSTTVEVAQDPRLQVSFSDMQTKDRLIRRLERNIEVSAQSMWRVQEAEQTLKFLGQRLKDLAKADSSFKDLQKQHKSLQDSLKQFRETIMGKEGQQGIVSEVDIISSELGGARYYIQSTWDKPTKAQEDLMKQNEARVKEMLTRLNRFFQEDWENFQKALQASKFSLFEEYEPLEIE